MLHNVRPVLLDTFVWLERLLVNVWVDISARVAVHHQLLPICWVMKRMVHVRKDIIVLLLLLLLSLVQSTLWRTTQEAMAQCLIVNRVSVDDTVIMVCNSLFYKFYLLLLHSKSNPPLSLEFNNSFQLLKLGNFTPCLTLPSPHAYHFLSHPTPRRFSDVANLK